MQWKNNSIVLATKLRERLLGLLSSKVCSNGETLMLVPCRSVHTLGVHQELDIAFLDENLNVIKVYNCVKGAKVFSHPSAVAVLERRSRKTPWFCGGDTLVLMGQNRGQR